MPSSTPPLATTLSQEHLLFCFDVLNDQLTKKQKNGKSSSNLEDITLPAGSEDFPLFITWNTISGSHTRLRGCIGTFEPLPLQEGLEEYSIIAAFKDRRFNPISLAELPKLECAISLLTKFEECQDYLDWELGTHGIYIDFSPPSSTTSNSITNRRNGSRGVLTATYLPDVAPAQGWTKVEAIDSAIQKAGYDGKITDELRKSLHVRRYQSEKASLCYADWKAVRDSS
jgi:AMME syndrome candidate gene 1 protein